MVPELRPPEDTDERWRLALRLLSQSAGAHGRIGGCGRGRGALASIQCGRQVNHDCSPPESVTPCDNHDRRSRIPKAGDWAGQRRYDRATQALRAARKRMDLYRAALDAGLSLRAVGKLVGMSY